MKIAAIILAAGRSRRFERGDKLTADAAGVPLLRRTAMAVTTVADATIVVSGPDDHERRAALDGLDMRHVLNPAPDRGQGRSIAVAVGQLATEYDGAMIVPGDMAALEAPLLWALRDTFVARHGERIVGLSVDGEVRPPVLWPRRLFAALRALDGEAGGKGLVQRHGDETDLIAVTPEQVWQLDDVDTAADLDRLVARLTAAARPAP